METAAKPKNNKIQIRLNETEFDMLDKICNPKQGTKCNQSEMIRQLIHREYWRRRRIHDRIPDADFTTDWRRGRPKAKGETE